MTEIRDLFFSYGEKSIFSGLSLRLDEPVSIIKGASGSGKTTLLRLIAGLLKPDGGEITGVPEKTAFLFQEDRLLPWLTAEENVAAVLPRERASETKKWLELLELTEDEAKKRPEDLSGGQRRRVSMARALSYGGELLILDEPMKGLDESLIGRIVPIIKAQGVPIIVTSHSEYEISLWDGEVITI